MLKEKWTRPTLAAFIMWGMRKASLFVETADGQGYVINPMFIQCGTIAYTGSYTASQTRTPVASANFSIPFGNKPIGIVCTLNKGTTFNEGAVLHSADLSETNIRVSGINTLSTALDSRTRYVSWFAIDPSFVLGKQMFGGGTS